MAKKIQVLRIEMILVKEFVAAIELVPLMCQSRSALVVIRKKVAKLHELQVPLVTALHDRGAGWNQKKCGPKWQSLRNNGEIEGCATEQRDSDQNLRIRRIMLRTSV